MNSSIFGMNHSPLNHDELSSVPGNRLTKREELEVAIRAQKMIIQGAEGFPAIIAKAEARLTELREQLRKMDEQDDQQSA